MTKLSEKLQNEAYRIAFRAAEIVKQGWCQNSFARDKDGNVSDIMSPDATCFCAAGAISKSREESQLSTDDALTARLEVMYTFSDVVGDTIVHYNDAPGRTQAEVVEALFKTAAKIEAR